MERDSKAKRARIRAKINPYSATPTYPTGWNGEMTFEAIRDALIPSINRLMRYYRYVDVDIPDMIAHGFMRLWEELNENPNLLAEMDKGGATKWVMYRSGSSHYQKFYRREMYMQDLATSSGNPDEFLIEGFGGKFHAGHANFAHAVENRIDIEQAIGLIAEKYKDSQAHLAALYYITTSVKPNDAAELAGRGGTKKSWWLTSVVKPLRAELCELLGLHRPGKTTWQEKVKAGNQDPLDRLVEEYQARGDNRMVATLHNLLNQGNCNALMEELDAPKTTVHRLRRKAHQALNSAYGCRR